MKKDKHLTKKDIKDWEEFTNSNQKIFDKERKLSPQFLKNRFLFDLHGKTLNEANKIVKNLIIQCVEKEYKEILLVTGKGIHSDNPTDVYTSDKLNKIRYSVPEFIKNDPDLLRLVVSVNPAEKKDGGDGALLIKLKTL